VSSYPNPEKGNVSIACREMLLKAIEHGAGLDPTKLVDIEYIRARHMITCRITDPEPSSPLTRSLMPRSLTLMTIPSATLKYDSSKECAAAASASSWLGNLLIRLFMGKMAMKWC